MNAATLALSLYLLFAGVVYDPIVANLGDNTFMVRENASKTLFLLGEAGHPIEEALERACRCRANDAEVVRRCEALLCTIEAAREARRKAIEEELAARRARYEDSLNVMADKLFPYYPFLDSLWMDRETRKFDNSLPFAKEMLEKYHNTGTRVFDKACWTDGRGVDRKDQEVFNLSSKRLAMDALSRGVSPLEINLLFTVMRVNDNLYLNKTLEPATTPTPEDLPPPEEKDK